MEDEVDLRNYINVLLKWKWLIIWITIISMLAAGVMSYFVIKPTYEASGSLLVNPKEAKVSISTPEQLLNPLVFLPEISVATYTNIVKSTNIEGKILKDLNLESPPYNLTLDGLNKIIQVENPKNTTLIKVSAQYDDPKIAQKIVEKALYETVQYVNYLNNFQLQNSSATLGKQFSDAKKRLEDAQEAIAEFNSREDNLDNLSREKTSYINALNDYLSQLFSLDAKINQYEGQLSSTQKELKNESKYLVVEKSILDDPLLSQLAQQLSNENIIYLSQLKVNSQEINPIYDDLRTKEISYIITLSGLYAQKNTLKNLASKAKSKIHQLDEEINDKQLKLYELNRELNIAKSYYSKISSNYQQSKLAQNNMLAPLTVSEEAVIPTSPIKPKKLFNIVVAGTAGFFFAILLAFFIEYMQGSEDEDKRKVKLA